MKSIFIVLAMLLTAACAAKTSNPIIYNGYQVAKPSHLQTLERPGIY